MTLSDYTFTTGTGVVMVDTATSVVSNTNIVVEGTTASSNVWTMDHTAMDSITAVRRYLNNQCWQHNESEWAPANRIDGGWQVVHDRQQTAILRALADHARDLQAAAGADPAWLTWNGIVTRKHLTEEERRAEDARRRQEWEEIQARRRIEEEVQRKAYAKAELLLKSCLTPQQKADLESKNFFYLHTPSGKVYRIDRGRSRNVHLVDPATGRVKRHYCMHPIPMVPDPDTMLAQKFMLETDEALFLATANAS